MIDSAEKLVRGLIDQAVEAWNQRDLRWFCSFYAKNASYVSRQTGKVVMGREAILQHYQETFPDVSSMGRLSVEIYITTVAYDYPIRPSSAVAVLLQTSVELPDGFRSVGWSSLVYQYVEGTFLIVQDHS